MRFGKVEGDYAASSWIEVSRICGSQPPRFVGENNLRHQKKKKEQHNKVCEMRFPRGWKNTNGTDQGLAATYGCDHGCAG